MFVVPPLGGKNAPPQNPIHPTQYHPTPNLDPPLPALITLDRIAPPHPCRPKTPPPLSLPSIHPTSPLVPTAIPTPGIKVVVSKLMMILGLGVEKLASVPASPIKARRATPRCAGFYQIKASFVQPEPPPRTPSSNLCVLTTDTHNSSLTKTRLSLTSVFHPCPSVANFPSSPTPICLSHL